MTSLNLDGLAYVPEHPLDLQGWGSTDAIFEELIIEIKPNIIVEVGTWKGASAIHMAEMVKKHNLNTKIYCIDTWLGAEEFWTSAKGTPERNLFLKNGYPSIYYRFLSNVFHTKNENIIIPIPNTSHIGAVILKYYNIKPDLIYIDGSHLYGDVLSDLNDYYGLLDNGKIIFGDDLNWESVSKAVNDFCLSKNISYKNVNSKWIINK